MIGVIVKDGNTIISKDVYSGNDQESLKVIAALADQKKTLTFEIHRDSDPDWKTAFEAVSVPVKAVPEWQTEKAKGADAAINFIASKIGLQ